MNRFRCYDCKYWKIGAEHDWERSICKRVDHKSLKFFWNTFKVYTCGDKNDICCDFEPKEYLHPNYLKEWHGYTQYISELEKELGHINITI